MPATTSAMTVTDVATKIISANSSRQELMITNNGIANDIVLGPDNTVTFATGLPLYAGQTRERSRGFSIWLGDVYGIANTGKTSDIRVWETTR